MATRGFLIRFIDVGLIVLFGFLMISDIEVSSHVELAGSAVGVDEEDQRTEPPAVLDVAISPTGAFTVSAPSLDSIAGFTVEGVAALTETLRRLSGLHSTAGMETMVLIRPHEASIVQATVDVMDICDRLSLPKSLQMDTRIEPGPDPSSPGSS